MRRRRSRDQATLWVVYFLASVVTHLVPRAGAFLGAASRAVNWVGLAAERQHTHSRTLLAVRLWQQQPTSWGESFSGTGRRRQPQPSTEPSSLPPQRPFPVMPSQLFQDLAISQLELLASSLTYSSDDGSAGGGTTMSKIRSMALYLPQENARTGQLEFLPAILYPRPSSERVFIASDSDSGVAPAMPRTLTKLPGFAHATSLLPGYPMVHMSSSSSSADHPEREASVGVVEEVMCDVETGGTALSVPLFAGLQTVGVLLVSPTVSASRTGKQAKSDPIWTEEDRRQVAVAAKSLSLALAMDSERSVLKEQNQKTQTALSDSLHQFKNPLQALRTYGKLLQRRIADDDGASGTGGTTPQLLELAEHLMVQSDRLVERLKPVDAIVDSMASSLETTNRPLLNPVEAKALVPWKTPLLPWEEDALDFAREMPSKNASIGSSPLTCNENSKLRTNDESDAPILKKEDTGTTTNSPFEDNPLFAAISNPEPPPSLLGEVKLEMAFIGDILGPVFEAFRAIASERHISFVVEEEDDLPGVTVWPQALQESVINLLDNAFKYVNLAAQEDETEGSFEPQVRVRLVPNKASIGETGVTILVEDNGPGISPSERDQVFERGSRGAQARALEGSGIGLDIARMLVEPMGGTLQVVDNTRYPNSLKGAVLELVVFRKSPLAR